MDKHLSTSLRRAKADPSDENIHRLGIDYLRAESRQPQEPTKPVIFIQFSNGTTESNRMGPFSWLMSTYDNIIVGIHGSDEYITIAERIDGTRGWMIVHSDIFGEYCNMDMETLDGNTYLRFFIETTKIL